MKRNRRYKPKDIGQNPFVGGLAIRYYGLSDEATYFNGKEVGIREGNIVKTGSSFTQKRIRDAELDRFVLEYQTYGKEDLLMIFDSLSDGAHRLYSRIKYALRKRDSLVFLDRTLYIEKYKISIRTYEKYITELVNCGIICEAHSDKYGWFWVNPKFVYSGFRLSDFKERKRMK